MSIVRRFIGPAFFLLRGLSSTRSICCSSFRGRRSCGHPRLYDFAMSLARSSFKHDFTFLRHWAWQMKKRQLSGPTFLGPKKPPDDDCGKGGGVRAVRFHSTPTTKMQQEKNND